MKEILILKEPLNTISGASDLFNKIKKIDVDHKQENFIIFCLDSKNKVIHKEVLFKGGLNECVIDTKTIFRIALKYNSNALIFAHNHPSGDLKPSDEDNQVKKVLTKAGEILHLKVLDNIIFNKNEYHSIGN